MDEIIGWSLILGGLTKLVLVWGQAFLIGLGSVVLMVIDHKLS